MTKEGGLNAAAHARAVYASQPPARAVHARLASGWWSSALAGSESQDARQPEVSMSRLRDRMIEDLRLRGSADNTIDTYVRCVRKLVGWAGVAPGKINAAMVRAFLL